MARYHVNINNLNLRQGPGTNFEIITELNINTVVEKLEASENGHWFGIRAVQNGNNLEGWVAGELLEPQDRIGWVDQIGDYQVERRPIPRPGNQPFLQVGHPMIGVLHTTEGSTVNSAFNTLSANFSAPHFIAGENKIVQCRPMTAQAAALKSGNGNFPNKYAAVQIEMVGFSSQQPWLPPNSSLLPIVAIMRWASKSPIDIPLRRPNSEWLDDCSDCPPIWASVNNRRRNASSVWAREKGWYMHMEVPHNDHWDCGALRWRRVLEMASS